MTKVVFRKWKEDGSIIALFPEEIWSKNDYSISSYMHHGQHGPADYDHVIRKTIPAHEDDYRELKSELESMGYSELKVMQRCRPDYCKLFT